MLITIHYFRARTTKDKIVDLALRHIKYAGEIYCSQKQKSNYGSLHPAIPGFSNQLRTTRTQAQ